MSSISLLDYSKQDVLSEKETKDLFEREWSVKDTNEKPPWDIDFVWTWCGWPESEHCRYTDDLLYSMRSICQNTPWFKNLILVVPDEWEPPVWLNANIEELRIIKHSQIIPRKYLPNWNSHVIQSWVFKIKGLSERFVFMTDDMYIGRRTPWWLFFDKETGKPINRHYLGNPDHGIYPDHRIPYIRMWNNAIKKHNIHFTRIQHQVLPYRISTIRKYYKIYQDAVHLGSQQRVRSGEADFNLLRFTTSLSTMNGDAKFCFTDDTDCNTQNVLAKIKRHQMVIDWFVEGNDVNGVVKIIENKPRFFCINNTSMGYTHVYKVLATTFRKRCKCGVEKRFIKKMPHA